jgi:RND superfamily putative drug exporter
MKVARAAISRPRLVLAIWGAVIGLLALRGIGVEERLHRASLSVPGGAAVANTLGTERFGSGVPVTILLQGPPREVERQGRRLLAKIERLPHARTLNPWVSPGGDGAARNPLRPRSDRALIVLRQNVPWEQQTRKTVPYLRGLMKTDVHAPVAAHLTGAPDVANGIHDGSLKALERAELIAAPLLLLVLLLVFRSPVAAAIPLLLGVMSIGAARGAIDLLNHLVELDAVALSIGSMLGLALGIDYSLLVVSRFREELAAGHGEREAASIAANRAGHTVLVAGIALLAAVAASLMLSPGSLLTSAAAGSVLAAAISVLSATTALPAGLVMLGRHVDRWRFGGTTGTGGGGARIALAALRRPVLAALAVGGLIAALAAPALALEIGPPDVRTLPSSSPERADYEAIRAAMGPGWMAPFDLIVVADRGPITTPARLRELDRFQARLARLPGVATVFGPSSLAGAERRLQAIPRTLGSAQRDQVRLATGMRRVSAGVGELRAGLGDAADGAAALQAGGANADDGATQLAAGLGRARRGADAVVSGLDRSGAGATSLATGVQQALTGVRRLAGGVDALRSGSAAGRPGVAQLSAGLRDGQSGLNGLREPAQIADQQLKAALAGLDGMLATSKLDPAYRRVYEAVGRASGAISGRDPRNGAPVRDGYDGLDASLASAASQLGEAAAGVQRLGDGLDELATGLARLDRGVGQLRAGLGRMRAGARRLQHGLGALRSGGRDLRRGLARLQRGAGALDSGTGRLAAGAGRLADGLHVGHAQSARLTDGVDRIAGGVAASRARTRGLDSDQLVRVARSGHLLLAAVDSAPAAQRDAAALVVNLDNGGSAVDITVIPSGDASHAGEPLRGRLEGAARDFTRAGGLRAYVGGAAPVFQDFDTVSGARLPWLVLGLVVLTYFALVAIFRSLLLPAIAVLLNVATVMAAFGVMALCFQGAAPLGGPGFLDAIIVLGTLSIVFGLSIDYAVFLVTRMREGYELTGTTEGAIEYGVNGTARIITGAATIMSGAFIALALAGMTTLRQFGVGLTVAVMLDATLVRLVLLPALVKLAGPAAWWLPAWLERRLPGGRPPVPHNVRGLWPTVLSPAAPGSSAPTSATSS